MPGVPPSFHYFRLTIVSPLLLIASIFYPSSTSRSCYLGSPALSLHPPMSSGHVRASSAHIRWTWTLIDSWWAAGKRSQATVYCCEIGLLVVVFHWHTCNFRISSQHLITLSSMVLKITQCCNHPLIRSNLCYSRFLFVNVKIYSCLAHAYYSHLMLFGLTYACYGRYLFWRQLRKCWVG